MVPFIIWYALHTHFIVNIVYMIISVTHNMYDNTCPIKLDKLLKDFFSQKYAQGTAPVWVRALHAFLNLL